MLFSYLSSKSSVFLRVLRFPQPIKLTVALQYNWNIVESGIKHYKLKIISWLS